MLNLHKDFPFFVFIKVGFLVSLPSITIILAFPDIITPFFLLINMLKLYLVKNIFNLIIVKQNFLRNMPVKLHFTLCFIEFNFL